MNWFTGHRIIEEIDGYIVELYVDEHLSEFARDFEQQGQWEKKQTLATGIEAYLQAKLPDLKIKAVHLMLGTILIATLPFGNEPAQAAYLQRAYLNTGQIVGKTGDLLILVNKTHSLAAEYIPPDLIQPDVPFPFEEFHEKKLLRWEAARALEELFQAADAENIYLYAISGFRSFERQRLIFQANVEQRGEEIANQFSARPGESEHQTGLAMDVSSPSVNMMLTQTFGETDEGKWLAAHAPYFGFIIRYQKGREQITGYQYEPWHIRYVGKYPALEIALRGLTLEEYLQELKG